MINDHVNDHLVNLPVITDFSKIGDHLMFPSFEALINRPQLWVVAAVMMLVASIETLLCVEATDNLDPEKRTTPTNRELIAQGAAGLIQSSRDSN